MQRRRVLAGFATAGVSLLAGCNTGGGGNNTTTTQSTNGGGTATTTADDDASIAGATTIAETAQTTASQTATPVSTTTPVPTAISSSTSTPMPTAASTEMATAGPGTVTGSMDIDLSNLTTYTNDRYSYIIEYPADWRVDDSTPRIVTFSPPTGVASMTVIVSENVSPSITLDQATRQLLRSYRESAGEAGGNAETLSQQDVTLPNGTPGRLFDFRLSSSGGVSVRQKVVITLVDGTLYAATIVVPEPAYTSTVGQQMDAIITSLTISSGPASA